MKFTESQQSNGYKRLNDGDLSRTDEKFGNDESSRRVFQFNKGLPNSESPSMKFEWNRLLFGPNPSNQSGFASSGVSTLGQVLEQEDSPVSLKKNMDVASEYSPGLGLSESKQEDYISLEEYSDVTDDTGLPCDTTHFIRCGPKEVGGRFIRWRSSEHSEEFKQLVNLEFLKYFKQLNENSTQRKRFTENSGRMTCNVCGRVFQDCKSLVAHAFGCEIPKLRTKHLGFHKALCALMGWKSGTRLERTWRYHNKLSDDEALALKEDLIIWPPVVIIHNSSIQSKNPDDRNIVSNKELCTMLKEMGYVGSVCRGKPANQSIMVVKFNGTLQGLQEAERLHKYYCVTNHGRSDLQQNEVSTESSKIESVLFGYLGLAEDLDKLDFETKKRRFVKSKKEIQIMVDAILSRPKSDI